MTVRQLCKECKNLDECDTEACYPIFPSCHVPKSEDENTTPKKDVKKCQKSKSHTAS